MTRTRAIAILFAALLYAIFPADVVPDVLPLIGWLDDLLALGLAGYLLWKGRRIRVERPRTPPPGWREAEEVSAEPENDDPYAILGVPRGASSDEIKQAYRARIAEYHPDKVAHLGPDLRQLAERKTLAIQRAYERLAG